MRVIIYYRLDGTVDHEEQLSDVNLSYINGMLVRCHMNDNKILTGFFDVFRTHNKDAFDKEIHDYINLWTWDNLDENTHQLIGDASKKYNQTFIKVQIDGIVIIEAILHSSATWGEKLTNKFFIDFSTKTKHNV